MRMGHGTVMVVEAQTVVVVRLIGDLTTGWAWRILRACGCVDALCHPP